MTRATQVETRSIKISTIIRSAAFVRGYKEALAGKPFDYGYNPADPSDLWAYERGRQFSLIWNGPLKHGNKVTVSAIYQYHCAMIDGLMI
jgi:hypothetical protein